MNIQIIEGLGPAHAGLLRSQGINTVEAMLEAGATKAGRRILAARTGLAEDLILSWVNRADLMRVRGVGRHYSDLLEAAGVDTIKELRRRRPDNLHAAMMEANAQRGLVSRVPTEQEVGRWIARALNLMPVVSY